MVDKLKMYIGGEWVDAESGETFSVTSPVTGETLAELPKGGREDVKKAVDLAVEAQEKVQRMPIKERIQLVYKVTEFVQQNINSYATDLTMEHGKILKEALIEVEDVTPNMLWNAEDLKRLETPVLNAYSKPDMMYIVVRDPLGTVGVITPWNFPWVLPAEFVVQAFLAGNSVVWKPASYTPISAVHMMECIDKAGIPPGFINMVTGPGDTTGRALVENPMVDGICFTGETTTGEDITKRAGLKKIILELGGLGPLIVMNDANVEKAVEDIIYGCYTTGGQCCCANERILVQEGIHDKLVNALAPRVKKMKLGDPLKDTTDMGPLNNEPVVQKMERHVEDAVNRGAKVLAGGARAQGFPTKLYYPPTIVDDVPTDALFNNVETFGPVAPIITFKTLDDAIEIANAPRYGLSMAIHTKNLRTAL
ncbi:MAG: aldehyde dehydrogenase family protein, partial [bacterium]